MPFAFAGLRMRECCSSRWQSSAALISIIASALHYASCVMLSQVLRDAICCKERLFAPGITRIGAHALRSRRVT